MRFSVTKRTGCRASSHIITSYVLKRNRKQANPKESRALFWVWAGRTGLKMPFFLNASLEILANQDQFPRWKSSLPEIFSKSGCISPTGIIPPGNFYQIRIHFSDGNHPSRTFPANQDAFPRWKSSLTDFSSKSGCILRRESSLTDFSSKSGCISSLEIIPPRHFLLIRMHFSVGNHPSQIFLANQDQSPRWKSSLADISC